MIVIYSQEQTYIEVDALSAKPILIELYGKKLGTEAYEEMKNANEGTTYRKHGGPLIKMVSDSEAKMIGEKEAKIGMLKLAK